MCLLPPRAGGAEARPPLSCPPPPPPASPVAGGAAEGRGVRAELLGGDTPQNDPRAEECPPWRRLAGSSRVERRSGGTPSWDAEAGGDAPHHGAPKLRT